MPVSDLSAGRPRSAFAGIAAFEFRYQARSPLFIATAASFLLIPFAHIALGRLVAIGGGQVLSNSPHAIIVALLAISLLFLLVGAAMVSDVVIRDDQTGFGPLVRSTPVAKFDYLIGRLFGAFAAGALVLAMAPLGLWLGTLMPFADPALLGPSRLSGFAVGYGLFALPNALIISAMLFALATATRSTAGTFVGVIALILIYLIGQRLVEGQHQWLDWRTLADPFGMSTYMASARYLTAAEINAGAVPVTRTMIFSRLMWVGLSMALLALTYARYRFADRPPSRRQLRKLGPPPEAKALTVATPAALPRLPAPRFGRLTGVTQMVTRARFELRFIVRSPAFLILLVLAFAFTLPGLLGATGFLDGPLYPLAFVAIPILQSSFNLILLVIAAYYAGELAWREREHGIHEIIGATPLSPLALMMPKLIALSAVLAATLGVGTAVGLLAQLMEGIDPEPRAFLLYYWLPGAVDAVLIAALALFVQAVSPGKYIGWAAMTVYIIVATFGPSLGLEHPLLVYGGLPRGEPSDLAGFGSGAAWWFRAFWAAVAALLMLGAQLSWPRGTEQLRLRQRIVAASPTLRRAALALTGLIALGAAWIAYNTLILNPFRSSGETQRYLAEYERRYFRFANLPQPTVRHVALDVALTREPRQAEVRGRFTLVNETGTALRQVHIRTLNRDLELLAVSISGARLSHDDRAFGYRIYRLAAPMLPGERRELAFHARRVQRGFRAVAGDEGLGPNGADLDTLKLMPRIGMSDVGLIEEPGLRRKLGLPNQPPLPRLDDLSATLRTPSGDADWTTAEISISTPADQQAVAPGRLVEERVEHGRRTVRFRSDVPIKNLFPIQSGRFSVARARHEGVDFAIYHNRTHRWNIDRMMTAMTASIDYYRKAFGPYPLSYARIVERPRTDGGQAFPGSIAVGEGIFATDLRSPYDLDTVTMLVAHEMAHQWWGQQVLGARMQGGSLLYETLSQYAALMVLRKLRGEANLERFLAFQRDRYLSGRRTQLLAEEPLVRVAISQQHIAYGKGTLAMYLLQRRLGESAVNRALKAFVDRYRFTRPPYPRSVDLIAEFRKQARTTAQQQLITDLFERITLYDLSVAKAVTRRTGRNWTTEVTVNARKIYADGQGRERAAVLAERIELTLFAAQPRSAEAGAPISVALPNLRSGRQVVRLVTARRPAFAAIDRDGLHIDRNRDDNLLAVAE